MIHSLKIKSEYFEKVILGEKNFEVRKNDRDFRVGDLLALNEYKDLEHTGRSCIVKVDYILPSSELSGIIKSDSGNEAVVMAIKPCKVYIEGIPTIVSPYITPKQEKENVCTIE